RATFLMPIYGMGGPRKLFADFIPRSIFRSLEQGIERYGTLSRILQTDILGGNLEILPEDESRVSWELLFKTKEGVELEMNIASSVVKELAPLALYLRYIAQPGEMLVIDEPATNLHPEAQAQITELLAMLVNADLPVLFTTHSPYIVDHLTNLIKAYESEDKE